EALHVHVARLQLKAGAAHLAALDVAARGSLAAWYASVLLLAATGWSFIVFAIRAHRVDDYRGRYRVWLWTTAALAWLSLDEATGRLKVHIDPDKKKGKPKSRSRLKVVKEEKTEAETTPAPAVKSPAAQPREPVKFGAPANSSAKSGATISSTPANYDDEDED